jgi:GST-like protein
MIDLYTWDTPNGHKASIMLEETGLSYRALAVNLGRGEQFAPDFLRISPNNKIPAIVDDDGPGGEPFALFESGAILVYLAEKSGRLLPEEPRARYQALAWLFFQVGHIGPMFGQADHFRRYAVLRIPYAIERYTREVTRLYRVLDAHLAEVEYLAGDYSIADIATFPWARAPESHGIDVAGEFPSVARWLGAVGERDAVKRGLEVPRVESAPLDEHAREVLFGAIQASRGAH